MAGVIAVHVGAGSHGESLRLAYKDACKNACSAAILKLRLGMDAVEAVTEAVCMLENCPLTNAGIGSNLTLNGVVECDAGIMDGKSLNFGSVGALSNVKNPIKVAQKILKEQLNGLLPGGRVPPCTLVGNGAKEWALDHGFQFMDNRFLSTKSSESAFVKNLSVVTNSSNSNRSQIIDSCEVRNHPSDCNGKTIDIVEDKNLAIDSSVKRNEDDNDLFDTVGAVCVDLNGNVASAVSSGGLLLKYSGRIGQASIFGSGCWAENSSEYDKPSIACCATGVGEYLIKTLFSRECYQSVYNNPDDVCAVPDFFKNKFIGNPRLQNISSKLAGVLMLKYFAQENHCEISWAHNTKTMILGHMRTDSITPTAVFSSQSEKAAIGESVVFSEKCFKSKHKS